MGELTQLVTLGEVGLLWGELTQLVTLGRLSWDRVDYGVS